LSFGMRNYIEKQEK